MDDSLHQLIDSLKKDYILPKDVVPGAKLPTIRQLVKQYAVSATTIVNALSILQSEGYVEKRQSVGVFVCPQPVKPDEVKRLGLILPYDQSELLSRVQEGVQLACQSRDWLLEVAASGGSVDNERELVRRMGRTGCQAICLYPVARTHAQIHKDYLAREMVNYPIVTIDLWFPEMKRPAVVFDNYRAGFDVTRQLIEHGHKRIAFQRCGIGPDDLMIKSNLDRYRGYLDAITSSGLDYRVGEQLSFHSWFDGSEQRFDEMMNLWLNDPHRPTAIIALADIWANLLGKHAQRYGVKVPEELEVAGFDNMQWGIDPDWPMLTSHPDFQRAGQQAALMATDMAMRIESDASHYMLPATVDYWKSNNPFVLGSTQLVGMPDAGTVESW